MAFLVLWLALGEISFLGAEESPVVVDTAAPEPRATEPASPKEPAKRKKKHAETVKQWLHAHPEEKVYAVVLGATMHRDRQLLNLRVSRVTDPKSDNTQPLEVEIPQSFLDRCRIYIEEGPFKPSFDHGLPVEFFTYVYYLPSYPYVVVGKLTMPMEKVLGHPVKPEPHMPKIPSLVSPDHKPVELPGGI